MNENLIKNQIPKEFPKQAIEKIENILKRIKKAKKILYFFDDDADGLSSFLQFYKYKKGDFTIIKGKPKVESMFLRSIEKYKPDLLIILDKPNVDDVFLNLDIPVIWIDHHPLNKTPENVIYFNPLEYKLNPYPVSYLSHLITNSPFWLSSIGIIGDWQVVDNLKEKLGEYDWLLNDEKKHIELQIDPKELLFKSNLSQIIRMFNFIMKGKNTTKIKKQILRFSEFNSPEEYIIHKDEFKELKKIEKSYLDLKEDAIDKNTINKTKALDFLKEKIKVDDELSKLYDKKSDKIISFFYNAQITFTGDLSNELLFLFPEKNIILIAREKNDEFILSLRSSQVKVDEIVSYAIKNITAQGGGHMYACGARVHKDSFAIFLKRILEKL